VKRESRRAKADIEVVGLEDRDRWVALHRNGGLPSQSWHYAWALSASNVTPRLAVVRAGGAKLLLPFYEREWNGSIDIATLLGTSGALIVPSSAAPLALWREYALAQGWVAGYIQLSTSVDLSGQTVSGELVDLNEWFVLDLTRDDLLEHLGESIRQKLRRCSTDGTILIDDRSELSRSLRHLFPLAMERVGARPHYRFSPESLDRWAMDPLSVVLGARRDGAVEAVSVFAVAGDEAEYHINGSSERGRDLAAWLIWQAIGRLKAKGVRTLHLGGGVRFGDGLYQFKRRFGGTPKKVRAVRQLYDHPRYLELCRLAGVSPGESWFPAYRSTRPGS
jgi:GNAT acetyltransferase-like protein